MPRRPPSPPDAPAAAGDARLRGDGTAPSGAGPLSMFGGLARDWFSAVFSAPTPSQAEAWAAIARGENTLVIAPTGSGKTLAAFLWAVDRLAAEPPPADPKLRCRVLYVSPLKALAVDVERNLRAPLTGIRHLAQQRGLPEPDIRVAVRTGDTAADERRRLASKPPDILITTPESLFLILTSRARDSLRGVGTVIVDEVHALAGNKRGAHLALSLERLDALRDPAAEPERLGATGDSGELSPAGATGGSGEPLPRAGTTGGSGGSLLRAGTTGGSGGSLPRAGTAQRIGLSATVRPAAEVAGFLGGSRPVTIAAPPAAKRLDLRIVVPVEDLADPDPVPGEVPVSGVPAAQPGGGAGGDPSGDPGGTPQASPDGFPAAGPDGYPAAGPADGPGQPGPRQQRSIWPHVEERVLDLIEQHRSTIVFANSRRLAERLCARLNELAADRAADPAAGSAQPAAAQPLPGAPQDAGPPAEIMAQSGAGSGATAEVARAHHGSVSRQERVQIEEALKAGRLPAVVATSSLELGIDMGAVDLVIQIESPPSVASGLQRTGRSGHHVGDISRGVIFPKYQGDLVQATVVADRMREGAIEELRAPRTPLDVLAQQIVAMVAVDDWQVDDLERVARRAAPFSGLTRGVLEAVLDMLAGRYPSEEFAELRPRLVWDRTAGTLRGRPGAQRLAVTSGGTIPDRGLFGVFLAGAQRRGGHSHRVGELDEEMVYESRVGDVFVLGASSWRIEDITADQVLVSPAPGQPGRLPFWKGDTAGRPAELGRAVGAFCREIGGTSQQQATARLRTAGLDELAAANLVRYLHSQQEATGYLPDDRTLVMERFRDELGDWRLVLHSPYGARVHAPWALAIAARLRERYQGIDVQALHSDDGIVLRVPDTDEPPPPGIAEFAPEEVESVVTAELGGSALFASRFRECAARSLLLPRRRPGRRSPLWQQRQRSAQLLAVASKYGSFPVVLETVRECLQDTFDVPALTALMRDLAARRVRLAEVETQAPSPFSRSLLFRYVGAFMYEGDSPLAERRAQALALDSSLLAELLGQADLRELLDPAVVADTEAGLQRLAADRRCRDLEGLADLLREIGPVSADEVSERCAEPGAAPDWLAALAGQRRAIEVRIAGQPRWAAIEDAGRLRDALGVPLPPGVPAAFAQPVPDPLGDLVARYARCHGPFTAASAAHRYGLGVAVVSGSLRRLAAEGRVAEGEFLPGERGTEWCDSGVLRLLRRRCLARLRKEAEPAPPEALAAFVPAWQNAGQPPASEGSGPGRRRPAGDWRRASADAVYDTVDRLAGATVPASALETLVLPGRVPGYQPAMLDELTAAGEVVWAGAGGLPGGDGWVVLAPAHVAPLLLPPVAEITMTPVHEAVLTALAGGGGLFFRMIADRVAGLLAGHDWREFSDPAVAAAIWDLAWAGRLTNDTLAPLRTVLASGRPVAGSARAVRASGPAAPAGETAGNGNGNGNGTGSGSGDAAATAGYERMLRLAGGPGVPPARGPGNPRTGYGRAGSGRPGYGRAGYRRGGLPGRSGPPTVTGRWSLVPDLEPDPTRRLHALARTLLDRHGILIRGTVAAERVPGGFGALYPVLRAMEEAGHCRRGYFVEGLGAAQFALPGAVDRMRAVAGEIAGQAPAGPPDPGEQGGDWGPPAEPRAAREPSVVVLAATDPASPYGSALPWPDRPGEVPGGHRPGRKAGALVILSDGRLVLYVERGGRTLLSWTADPALLAPAAAALAGAARGGALGRLTVERADGAGVHDSPLAQALEAAGFRPTPRGLRLRR